MEQMGFISSFGISLKIQANQRNFKPCYECVMNNNYANIQMRMFYSVCVFFFISPRFFLHSISVFALAIEFCWIGFECRKTNFKLLCLRAH